MGMGTRFTVKILVSKWYKGVEGPTRPHKARHEKEVWAKQGRVIKVASRWHTCRAGSYCRRARWTVAPWGEERGEGRSCFEESDPKSELFSERGQRERRERERERERDRCICLCTETAIPTQTILTLTLTRPPPSLPAEQ